MTEDQKKRTANWLVTIAIVCLVVGGVLWSKANSDADAENGANDFVTGVAGGRPKPHVDADTTLPTVLIGIGAFSMLSAVILFAGSRSDPDS